MSSWLVVPVGSISMQSVEVLRNGDRWLVRVIDGQVDEREFLIEKNAFAWALGHRKRMGLPPDPGSAAPPERGAELQTQSDENVAR